MISNHFIKEIQIENYKCFNNFEAKGLDRVNLISGKNNSGKTVFLESLFINTNNKKTLDILIAFTFMIQLRIQRDFFGKAISNKEISEILFKNGKSFNIKSNTGNSKIELEKTLDGNKYRISNDLEAELINEEQLTPDALEKFNNQMKSGFISTSGPSQRGLIKAFTTLQYLDRESEVSDFIKKLDPAIENVKIIGGTSIECKVGRGNGRSSYHNLNDFGDGFRQFLSLIIDLYAFKDGYLFIDEIDNGIHYTVLETMWDIVLTLSKENNVQVFATTHSLECIQAYSRAAEKLNDKEITFTTLAKNKNKQVKSIVRDYAIFTSSIQDGNEVRGW